MLKTFFGALLCSVVLIGKIQAQEVIVAREKKSEPLKQTSAPPQQTALPSEEMTPDTATPKPRKSKPREKRSTQETLTLEDMREAGARAAGGSNTPATSPSRKTGAPLGESAPAPNPAVVVETPRPIKREMPAEQRSSPRSSKSRGTNLEGIGPIRPTMIESGREPPSPSPSGR